MADVERAGGSGGALRRIDGAKPQLPIPAAVLERAREFEEKDKASSTRAQYRSARRHFAAWCKALGRTPLPADWETVRAYVVSLADDGYAWSTIRQRLSAISAAHQDLEAERLDFVRKWPERASETVEIEDPCLHHRVKRACKGVRREILTAPAKKRALEVADVRKLAAAIRGDDDVAARDRAVILLGFAGGFRRAELAGLDLSDLEFTDRGLRVVLRRSKKNQEGRREVKAIPSSAEAILAAVREWLRRRGPRPGPLFLSAWVDGTLKDHRMAGKDVGRMVVRRLVRAGMLRPLRELRAARERNPFGAHSLRSGFVTSAHRAGARVADIMRTTGQSMKTVHDYIQEADEFENTAGEGVLW